MHSDVAKQRRAAQSLAARNNLLYIEVLLVFLIVGTLAAGKYADVIAVRGDVLHHIDLLQNVDLVIKHGIRFK